MIDIKEEAFGIADGDVDPGKNLAYLLFRDDLGAVTGDNGLEVCI